MQVGDKVERLRGSHHGMDAGDRATIVGFDTHLGIRFLDLKGFSGYHRKDHFKVVDNREQIISKNYDI